MINMRNILLVDDDEIILKVLFKLLQNKGFNVVKASDGQEGLKQIELMKFDLVISDIMMPYLNGFEFIQELKLHTNTKEAKVLVISSITHQDSIIDSKKIGVDLYMPKPIVIDEFLIEVFNLLK